MTGRESVKLFPDSFMADPSVPPSQIATLLGYDSDASELFEITVAVLGYHDKVMSDFINPRAPPNGGAPIFIAEDEFLGQVLNKRKVGSRGSAQIAQPAQPSARCGESSARCQGFYQHTSRHHCQHG